MKQNPLLIALAAVGLVGLILGLVLTLMHAFGVLDEPLLATIGGLLFTLGATAGVGALVLAGVEWRQRHG